MQWHNEEKGSDSFGSAIDSIHMTARTHTNAPYKLRTKSQPKKMPSTWALIIKRANPLRICQNFRENRQI